MNDELDFTIITNMLTSPNEDSIKLGKMFLHQHFGIGSYLIVGDHIISVSVLEWSYYVSEHQHKLKLEFKDYDDASFSYDDLQTITLACLMRDEVFRVNITSVSVESNSLRGIGDTLKTKTILEVESRGWFSCDNNLPPIGGDICCS